jgi:DNA-binding transcriptional regulator YbjK
MRIKMPKAKKTSTRRIATPGSASWHAMLDGAEVILRDEGYGALTSRRVAECIKVKQRLVYYYFNTMDDLIVETFRRLSSRELERLRQALDSKQPLRHIWDVCIHTSDARMVSEFIALANRNERLKKEVVDFIEQSRVIQVKALRAAFAGKSTASKIAPAGLAMMATSLALAFVREKALGVSTGHREILAAIGDFIGAVEPASRARR